MKSVIKVGTLVLFIYQSYQVYMTQVVNLSDTVRLKRTRRRTTDARGEDQMSWSSTETRLLNPFIFTFLHFTPFPKVAQPLIVNKTNTRDSALPNLD